MQTLRAKMQNRAARRTIAQRAAIILLGLAMGATLPPMFEAATASSFRFEVRAPHNGQRFTIERGLTFEACLDHWQAFTGSNLGTGCHAETRAERFAALVR